MKGSRAMRSGAADAKLSAKGGSSIDKLMDRASRALEATKYFETERLAAEALRRAHAASDFERMARIILPLQEARRQKRQLAIDAGRRFLVNSIDSRGGGIDPGCYLFQPPLIAADVRSFREMADAKGIPILAITREPLARDGKWPVVAVGAVSVRTKVEPPWHLERVESSITKDNVDGVTVGPPPVEWFEAAAEAMGDAVIAKLKPEDPAAWRVDDLMEFLDAHPDHEKLHQRLADNCRQAMTETLPEGRRHRPTVDDPYSF
jgi:hypothetical protein